MTITQFFTLSFCIFGLDNWLVLKISWHLLVTQNRFGDMKYFPDSCLQVSLFYISKCYSVFLNFAGMKSEFELNLWWLILFQDVISVELPMSVKERKVWTTSTDPGMSWSTTDILGSSRMVRLLSDMKIRLFCMLMFMLLLLE